MEEAEQSDAYYEHEDQFFFYGKGRKDTRKFLKTLLVMMLLVYILHSYLPLIFKGNQSIKRISNSVVKGPEFYAQKNIITLRLENQAEVGLAQDRVTTTWMTRIGKLPLKCCKNSQLHGSVASH